MRTLIIKFPALLQMIRYGIVGVANNLISYLIYLLMTYLWLDPKVAVTLFYPIGAVTAYFGHYKYSFSYQGKNTFTMLRYGLAHVIGYSINLMMLLVLSDKFQLPHQAVQALAILVVAFTLFLLLKYFVFTDILRK